MKHLVTNFFLLIISLSLFSQKTQKEEQIFKKKITNFKSKEQFLGLLYKYTSIDSMDVIILFNQPNGLFILKPDKNMSFAELIRRVDFTVNTNEYRKFKGEYIKNNKKNALR